MSKHSPGPWDYSNSGPNDSVFVAQVDDDGMPVKTFAVVLRHGTEDEQLANARLIAAAPELLEALKEICAFECLDDIEKAEALIARIEKEDP